MESTRNLSQSPHYHLESIVEGVYAAIASDGGAAISNAGLVDLGSRTLVFDTFLTPQAAADLAADAVRLTGRFPTFVVNSHHHNDHTWGNQVYAGRAEIYATSLTRRLIATAGKEQLRSFQQHAGAQLAALQEKMAATVETAGEAGRKELALSLAYYQGLGDALPTLALCLPEITFEKQIVFHGAKNSAHLLAFEGGHSASDAVLYLPEPGILFMGDLLFAGCHPYLVEGDPLKLLDTLGELANLRLHALMPGHGPVSDAGVLQTMTGYVEHILEVSRHAGDSEIAVSMPEAYQDWGFREHYLENIRAIAGC